MPPLEGVLRQTTHASVLETLRKAILSGDLPSGTPLVQADLSVLLGVSKTPIREAIRDLASEGLIDFDSYRSSVVHTPTLEEAREIYELRLTLEPLAIRKAAESVPETNLDLAGELIEQMKAIDDPGEWIEMNGRFHGLLSDKTKQPRLNGIIVGLRNASAIQVAWSLKASPGQMARANQDHIEILEAYRARDVDAAIALSRRHMLATLEAIEATEAGSESAA
ncbi:MAG: GntR family transcriptional regulator [Thermoleophilia bacterium]|nr:GntR family transcriptional regulator [Thermoleophilia bacterium]